MRRGRRRSVTPPTLHNSNGKDASANNAPRQLDAKERARLAQLNGKLAEAKERVKTLDEGGCEEYDAQAAEFHDHRDVNVREASWYKDAFVDNSNKQLAYNEEASQHLCMGAKDFLKREMVAALTKQMKKMRQRSVTKGKATTESEEKSDGSSVLPSHVVVKKRRRTTRHKRLAPTSAEERNVRRRKSYSALSLDEIETDMHSIVGAWYKSARDFARAATDGSTISVKRGKLTSNGTTFEVGAEVTISTDTAAEVHGLIRAIRSREIVIEQRDGKKLLVTTTQLRTGRARIS